MDSRNPPPPPPAVPSEGNQSKSFDSIRNGRSQEGRNENIFSSLPAVTLPKGGGAVRGLDEKFSVNPTAGTVTMSIPIPITAGRNGFQPSLGLSYSSGSGNGPFGMGWSLTEPRITRKTDKGLPRYNDVSNQNENDVFIMAGQDLVPVFARDQHEVLEVDKGGLPVVAQERRDGYVIETFSPRVEASFTRIERWTAESALMQVHWRTITGDNVTSIYGRDDQSRIYDPVVPGRIFSWLLSETYSVDGNAAIFEYKREDSANVPLDRAHEVNRTDLRRSANRYLKRVRYGNRVPNRTTSTWTPFSAFDLDPGTWMFSLVLDYGEHDFGNPSTKEDRPWANRQDAVSSYKAGFEIRTYRLCRRFLMFHHFSELGQADYLTKSTDLEYDENSFGTYLIKATLAGYIIDTAANGYVRQTVPPLEFSYSQFPTDDELAGITVNEFDQESLENVPSGTGGPSYQFLDLDGEGLPGIFIEQGDGWYYKRNSTIPTGADNGPTIPRFDPLRRVDPKPTASLASGKARFVDLAGDGHLDIVTTEAGVWSYSERTEDDDWTIFMNMRSVPNIDLRSPHLRLLDVTGNGLADIVIDNDDVFVVYLSMGGDGYTDPLTVYKTLDEESGPRIVFADPTESIYLADISGDGLVDILRVRNADVCYWPNLGYGQFGPKVTIDNAPIFDSDEQFNQRNLHVADIDGSGTSDLIYIGRRGIQMYLNQAGNAFSSRKNIAAFPTVDNLSHVDVVDLMGSGTACVVWSSSLPGYAGSQMKYVDIARGMKPHLLTKFANNLGSETSFRYSPSTKFYQMDRFSGQPWITRLAFPVHCAERVETFDHISKNRFVQRYAYHHGCFDGREREFSGFAMVEQWDTESFEQMTDAPAVNVNAEWHIPPVYTKTWFHTGTFIDGDRISRQLAHEYFGAPDPKDPSLFEEFLKTLLDGTVLTTGLLSVAAMEEACRGLRERALRTEIYAKDASIKSEIPYRVSEVNYSVVPVQEQPDNHGHLVVRVDNRETLSYDYERRLEDPRISHAITLDVDKYGNVLKAIQIAYGRVEGIASGVGKTAQETSLVTYSEKDVTNLVLDSQNYQLPKVSEARTYQIYGLKKSRYKHEDFSSDSFKLINSLANIPFEKWKDTGGQGKRLISQQRSIYRSDDLSRLLPKGELHSIAILGESYSLAGGDQGGYTDLDKDGNWWIPSGKTYFSLANVADELGEARSHFYLPRRHRNPFGKDTSVYYDTDNILITLSVDALNNEKRAENDYRLMRADLVIDENGNRAQCAFDPLGYVIGVAAMGKVGENVGDSMEAFRMTISRQEFDTLLENPRGPTAGDLLGKATSRTVYGTDNYFRNNKPVFNITISREAHVSQSNTLTMQIVFTYLDGFGREVQKKVQTEAGDVRGQPVISRWITSGWKIFNNKGNTVREYEPFFDDTHIFKSNQRIGVATTNIFDPMARIVAQILPNHSWTKSVYQLWELKMFDANDIVLTNPPEDLDVGAMISRLPPTTYLPTWHEDRISGQMGAESRRAAEKAAAHANTPTISQSDPLGRMVVRIADNGQFGTRISLTTFDIQGNACELTDPLNRVIERNSYSMTGVCLQKESMDAGTKWKLQDIATNPIRAWDSRNHTFRTVYDELRRPLEMFVSDSSQTDTKISSYLYGEALQDQNDATQNNKGGKLVELRDQAGMLVHDRYDFKGNLIRSHR